MTTKKTPNGSSRRRAADGLRPAYRLDYRKSRPNRFAERMAVDAITVVLDPDVAAVFDSSESVNAFLRSAIAAMPRRRKTRSAVPTSPR